MKSTRALKKENYADSEVDSDGTWALSYGDMITLLLSFFVIFFTTDFKKEKVDRLNRHLSFTLEGSSELTHIDSSKKNELIGGIKFEGMKAILDGEIILVSFGEVSFFNSGEVKVHQSGEKILKEFAKKFLPYAGNYRLSLKGFTDKRKVRQLPGLIRKYEDNLELSALRSLAAIRILQKEGIPLNRMEMAGGGELEVIQKLLPHTEGLSEGEINSISRTIVLVIRPEKESWL